MTKAKAKLDTKVSSESQDEIRQMNPDIREVSIGRRYLYTMQIYPLSFNQQIEISNVIAQGLAVFFEQEDKEDMATVAFFVGLIKDNMGKLIEFTTDPEEVKEIVKEDKAKDIMECITNKQLVHISELIYQDNFEEVQKKVTSLFEKIKGEFLSERLSVESSDIIPSTTSPTSSEEPIEKEELQ
jgi:hypothetical protein